MTSFRIDEKGQIWMSFFDMGNGGTINLSEHIRQIIREELLRAAAESKEEEK